MMILSLLYGLRNIDFFDFVKSFTSTDVYPFLIIFIVLLPFFIFAEKKAADPIMNLDYFREAPIVITLIISFITGVIMMGMVFVPQFAENALRMQQGSGGYFVMVLGIFAGVGAPVSGRLIDRYGPKLIMGAGFLLSIIGSLFLVLVTTSYPNLLTVAICLILIGLGMGFTMGTPLNYMMLDNTKKADSNSALATLSLIRSAVSYTHLDVYKRQPRDCANFDTGLLWYLEQLCPLYRCWCGGSGRNHQPGEIPASHRQHF